MKLYRYIIFLFFLTFTHIASAQFYVTGDNPGRAKWYSIQTDNFNIIYPENTDSLARTYAEKLERYRIPVSRTAGYLFQGYKMPVVMHAYNAANGSVAWAPKRMDLFTLPSAYDPEPMPWSTMLSVHESRHVAQMQFGMTDALKGGNYLFGQMFNILVSILYPGIDRMEGDAVIMETALTPSGRGRTAEFLNYYWVAFDQGDHRKWVQWRFPSQKYYGPDYYSLGYLTVGGFRYLYDYPYFMGEAYHRAAHKPYDFRTFTRLMKEVSGRNREDMFSEIRDTMYTLWNASAEKRKPYIPASPVTDEKKWYTDYTGSMMVGNDIYAIKQGHVDVPAIVQIDSTGHEEMVTRIPYSTSGLQWSEDLNSLYWSETKTDERWSLETKSKIRYIHNGVKRTLDSEDLLFNPVPTPSDGFLMSIRYEIDGRSCLDIVDGLNGKRLHSFPAPDSLQIVECTWLDDYIYTSAVSENGYGIYRFGIDRQYRQTSGWETVLDPEPVMIMDFSSRDGQVLFSSDRTGVNEFYHLDPQTGNIRQITSLRYGGSDFQYSQDGRYLYFSAQTYNGKKIFRTPTDSLLYRTVDFTQLHRYPIAEKVTQQEKDFALQQGGDNEAGELHISEPKRYRKLPHMIGLHSWAPVYVNVDRIMNMSFDHIWQAASLGATGIFQNSLSTSIGEFGYSAHKDPYNKGKWRHSGHARLTYSGLYPVIEAKINVNDRAARQFNIYEYRMGKKGSMMEVSSDEMSTPYIEGIFSAYIPFNLSSGGWHKGLIPKVSYSIGNDMFDTSVSIMDMETHYQLQENGEMAAVSNPVFRKNTEGKNTFRHSISGSLRAYASLSTPNSAIYPKWGIGVETGAAASIESIGVFSPMGYFYTYGYIPGFAPEQGIRLTAMVQNKLSDAPFGQPAVNILPRGLSGNTPLLSWLSIRNTQMSKITAEYAMPIYIGDISVGGSFFAIKRLALVPHFDCTFTNSGNLWSAGVETTLDLNSILTLGWPCSMGISASYNGGSALRSLAQESGIAIDRFNIGPTFNVTF